MFKNYLLLMRPFQWIKNIIIFIPLIFSKKLFDIDSFIASSLTFFCFVIASSIIYIFNDILDLKEDQKHPIKKKIRPLANKSLKVKNAYVLILLLMTILIYTLSSNIIITEILIIFFILNFFYSIYLKKIAIIDLFSVVTSYILRVVAGGVSINVSVSGWLLICIFCTALFLIAFKRLAEIKISNFKSRIVLKKYNKDLLLKIIDISSISSIIFYSLYTILVNTKIIYTIPLVFMGFFRYYHIYLSNKNFDESPVKIIFGDRQIVSLIIIWIIFILLSY